MKVNIMSPCTRDCILGVCWLDTVVGNGWILCFRCWEMEPKHPGITWILRGPISLSIIVRITTERLNLIDKGKPTYKCFA